MGEKQRLASWKPGLLVAMFGVLLAAGPALLGAEVLREHRVYSSTPALGEVATLNAGEASIQKTLMVAAVIVVWVASIGVAALLAAVRGLSFWRTCLPVVLAVPLTSALCMYGGAAIAAQRAADLVVGADDLHGGSSHLAVRSEVR